MSDKKYNVVFIIIDALRFDVINQQSKDNQLTPTINTLCDKGILQKITTNGQVTKFVVPSIFTQTYPLDYGGYNTGIKNRPASFVELLKDAGYSCQMFEGHDIDGPFGRCERGFDKVNIYYDKRLALEGFLKKKLLYEILQWRKGLYSDYDIIQIVQSEFDALLEHLAITEDRCKEYNLWPTLGPYRKKEIKSIQEERDLLRNNPMLVIEKVESISPYFYYSYLGDKKAGISLKFRNKIFSILKKIQIRINNVLNTELCIVPSRPRIPPICSKLFNDAAKCIEKLNDQWFVYIHIMDPHDHNILIRPLNLIIKLLHLPKVIKYRKLEENSGSPMTRRLSYDLTLSYVDSQLSKLIKRVEKSNQSNETLFLIIGDHGDGWDSARDESLRKEFGFRTHYEHITIPLVLSPVTNDGNGGKGMFDSMSISASLLDIMKIKGHPSFKGKSIFYPGLDAVITENCGRGNADIEKRDIYFTVTSQNHKLFIALRVSEVIVERLYDTDADPRELTNIVGRTDKISIIDSMLEYLFKERGELLELRGILSVPQVNNGSAMITMQSGNN